MTRETEISRLTHMLTGWLGEICHPASPMGGGGPGQFTTSGPLGLNSLLEALHLDFRSPTARHLLPHQVQKHAQRARRRAHPVQKKVAAPGKAVKSTLTDQDFEAAAKALGSGISPALVRAFAEVESGGRSGFRGDGLPVIAYEGHVFRKLTHRRFDHDYPLLSYRYVKKAGPEWQKNNKDHATSWATLTLAASLDHDAALQACSWGMFQVMGFNFKECGYATPDLFVAAMKAGEAGQLQAFVGFCRKKPGMVTAMQQKDYVQMATLYNGADYGDYDKRIERAYKRHGGT